MPRQPRAFDWRRTWPSFSAAGLVVMTTALGASSCDVGTLTDGPECDVPKLLSDKCSGSICHGAQDPAAGLDLISPGVVDRLAVVWGSGDCSEEVLLEPGYPDNSLLIEKVSSESPSCGFEMPPGGPALTSFQVACLRRFVEETPPRDSCETCGGITCLDLMVDEGHCGDCDTVCDAQSECREGVCEEACDAQETLCDTTCVDLEADEQHCGSCGKRCGPGTTCEAGSCVCDPEATGTFTDDVMPVLKASCGGNDCHTGEDTVSGLSLAEDVAYAQLVDVASDGCEGQTRVVPGDPGSSYLVEKMVGGAMCNGNRMPLFEELPEEAIAKIVGWICAGAPDD